MHKKTVLQIVIALTMLAMLISIMPVNAWYYPDSTTAYEKFGPRARRLLYKLYADDTAEFEALKAADIDIVDWPLSKAVYEEYTSPPYDALINCVSYGPEYGIYLWDLNCNNNEYLGNPPDPLGDPNPVYPNPMSSVHLRRAVGHCLDRDGLIADPSIGAGFGLPMYTAMSKPNAKYLLDIFGNTTAPWVWEYNLAAAEAILDAGGFANKDGEGYRIWDETGETVELICYIRSDHPGRTLMGDMMVIALDAVDIKVDARYATSGTTFVEVMLNKNFHMYTGGWNLGSTPDHLILWSWDYYWHPGFCYDYAGCNDAEFNQAAEDIMFANTQEEAVFYAMKAQWRQAYMVLGLPVYCVSGQKAYYKTYTGAEAPYTGQPWWGVGNVPGAGIDNGYTFLNMHPEGYPTSAANDMTIRYGMKVPEMKMLNIIYASWLYDHNVLDYCYFDSLLGAEQYDTAQLFDWATEMYELGTYTHPTLGSCSAVKFSLRDDMFWNDGTPITLADIYYTYVEIKADLEANGYPPPWWWSNVENILSFSVIDPYNFEVLLEVKSYWAIYWVGFNYILPKHIWKPIIDSGDPQSFIPDPEMVASGPWRFVEYEAYSHVLLVANEPGSDVRGIVSPSGFFRYWPVDISATTDDFLHKVEYGTDPVTFTISAENMLSDVAAPGGLHGTVTVERDNVPQPDPALVDLAPQTPLPITVITGHYILWYGYSYVHIIEPNMFEVVKCVRIYSESGALVEWAGGAFVVDSGLSAWICVKVFVTLPAGWVFIHPPSTRILTDLEWFQFSAKEDITGSTWYDDVALIVDCLGEPIRPDLVDYAHKLQLPTCDFKVDMRDIGGAARAFGSYPGHERWSAIADINDDKKVDMRDIGGIARMFGWSMPVPRP